MAIYLRLCYKRLVQDRKETMRAPTIKWIAFCVFFIFVLSIQIAFAGFIDFENGIEGYVIASTIEGLEFTNTQGFDWLYGDWRTNTYNGPYPNHSVVFTYPLETQYYSDGNFFAWMGTDQGKGKITFTQSYATYFQVGFSTASGVTLEAYDDSGSMMDQDIGSPNLGTGRLDTLRVEAPGMAYIMIYGTNNQWLIDNLETDAIQQCIEDLNCDDGLYCNGVEKCSQYQCLEGQAVVCSDDGLFCNGEEECSEENQGCIHTGDPCLEGDCNEVTDTCDDLGETEDDPEDDSEDEGDEDLWPKGSVSGGCCG